MALLKPEVLDVLAKLFDLDARPGTPAEVAAEKDIRARGTFAPEVITQGTMAFAFTFDTGFKLVWRPGAGRRHIITVEREGYVWEGQSYSSLQRSRAPSPARPGAGPHDPYDLGEEFLRWEFAGLTLSRTA